MTMNKIDMVNDLIESLELIPVAVYASTRYFNENSVQNGIWVWFTWRDVLRNCHSHNKHESILYVWLPLTVSLLICIGTVFRAMKRYFDIKSRWRVRFSTPTKQQQRALHLSGCPDINMANGKGWVTMKIPLIEFNKFKCINYSQL